MSCARPATSLSARHACLRKLHGGLRAPAETLAPHFREEELSEVQFYCGCGCPACRGACYKGRIAFHELVLVTEEVRTLIAKGASPQEITNAAAKVG